MLVLSRKISEYIQLRHRVTGEIIEFHIVDVKGDRVRVGTEASQDWQILRDELIPENQMENPNGETKSNRTKDHPTRNQGGLNSTNSIRDYIQHRKSGEGATKE